MIEYLVFFGLLSVALICYLLSKRWNVEKIIIDAEWDKTESPIERKLYSALLARGEYVKTQVPCGKYRIDISLPAYRLAIECDGFKYHSSPEAQKRDRRKDAVLRQNGWIVLRFWGWQIYKSMPYVLKKIEETKRKQKALN